MKEIRSKARRKIRIGGCMKYGQRGKKRSLHYTWANLEGFERKKVEEVEKTSLHITTQRNWVVFPVSPPFNTWRKIQPHQSTTLPINQSTTPRVVWEIRNKAGWKMRVEEESGR